jgi:dTDP-4-dehydrorhamnose 3,5-epimerase
MIFTETRLKGAFLIGIERHEDFRGYFARTFCEREFAERGLKTHFVQSSLSYNRLKGTLRGMHFQSTPMQETKLIRCTRGAIFDVIIDLRRDSPSFKEHFTVALTADDAGALYVPEGFAHGFQTLANDTELTYQMTEFFAPELSHGVRWDDPAFGIAWPAKVQVISERDRTYPNFE